MLYDCRTLADRDRGVAAAVTAVRNGDLVVLPTDTVYGIGADAFRAHSVTALLQAKGRGRQMPSAVLIGSRRTLDGLVTVLSPTAKNLVAAFWPGALTIIVRHAPSLKWDLGDTGGTVAVRMPLHPVALEVLRETGPMAVSSANKTGQPAAVTAEEAREQLGYSVKVYLEAGPCPDPVPSTIVDLTGEVPRVLRDGAIPLERLREVVPDMLGADGVGPDAGRGAPDSGAGADPDPDPGAGADPGPGSGAAEPAGGADGGHTDVDAGVAAGATVRES